MRVWEFENFTSLFLHSAISDHSSCTKSHIPWRTTQQQWRRNCQTSDDIQEEKEVRSVLLGTLLTTSPSSSSMSRSCIPASYRVLFLWSDSTDPSRIETRSSILRIIPKKTYEWICLRGIRASFTHLNRLLGFVGISSWLYLTAKDFSRTYQDAISETTNI